jgi:hypothetical protein
MEPLEFSGAAGSGMKGLAWVESRKQFGKKARSMPSLPQRMANFSPLVLSNVAMSVVRGKTVVRYQFALFACLRMHHAQWSTSLTIAVNLQKTRARPD